MFLPSFAKKVFAYFCQAPLSTVKLVLNHENFDELHENKKIANADHIELDLIEEDFEETQWSLLFEAVNKRKFSRVDIIFMGFKNSEEIEKANLKIIQLIKIIETESMFLSHGHGDKTALYAAIKANISIKNLSLYLNDFEASSRPEILDISSIVKDNKCLQSLEFTCFPSNFSEISATALLLALQNNTCLQKLRIRDESFFSDDGDFFISDSLDGALKKMFEDSVGDRIKVTFASDSNTFESLFPAGDAYVFANEHQTTSPNSPKNRPRF